VYVQHTGSKTIGKELYGERHGKWRGMREGGVEEGKIKSEKSIT